MREKIKENENPTDDLWMNEKEDLHIEITGEERLILSELFKYSSNSNEEAFSEEFSRIVLKDNSKQGRRSYGFYVKKENSESDFGTIFTKMSSRNCIANYKNWVQKKDLGDLKEIAEFNMKIVELIAQIMKTFPMSVKTVLKLLENKFPHKRIHLNIQYLYISALLSLANVCLIYVFSYFFIYF